LDEKDVQVELANGVLAIAGEKKDGNRGEKDRLFSERHYGGFERCIPSRTWTVYERGADLHTAEGSGSALTHRNQHSK
jgi:hypothetical protein